MLPSLSVADAQSRSCSSSLPLRVSGSHLGLAAWPLRAPQLPGVGPEGATAVWSGPDEGLPDRIPAAAFPVVGPSVVRRGLCCPTKQLRADGRREGGRTATRRRGCGAGHRGTGTGRQPPRRRNAEDDGVGGASPCVAMWCVCGSQCLVCVRVAKKCTQSCRFPVAAVRNGRWRTAVACADSHRTRPQPRTEAGWERNDSEEEWNGISKIWTDWKIG
jgi:hypothetical protein